MLLEVPDGDPRIDLEGYPEARPETFAEPGGCGHIVQLYDNDDALGEVVGRYLAAGLAAGEPILVVATETHRRLLADALRGRGFDLDAACAAGRATVLDASQALAGIMDGTLPSQDGFDAVVASALGRAAAGGVRVRAYGEMVDVLWREGKQKAAVVLEQMWNELATRYPFSLLCAYVMGPFYRQGDAQGLHDVCRAHGHVIPPESYRHLQAEIQHRKAVEQALRESVADLRRTEDALRRAAAEREELIEDLSRTVRFSEMFVGILGHDLRNPLSAITTASSHLLRRATDEKVARTVGRIVSSSNRMARMIDQLLDFTQVRLGRGLPLAAERTDLAEVCRLALDELDDLTAGRTVAVEVKGDPVGQWDVDRLGQLVSNLLGNALHHGLADAPVMVTVDGRTPDSVRLEISNRGTIPAEILPLVFEPFRSSADRKEARSSGLGLGLFISQQIVLAHGGSLDVQSSELDGTRFTALLPRRVPARPGEAEGSPERSHDPAGGPRHR
jgi:signal transduction histidine kinase